MRWLKFVNPKSIRAWTEKAHHRSGKINESTEQSGLTIMEVAIFGLTDIKSAPRLKSVLAEALSSEGDVVLDAADVTRADTAALQVLAAFFGEANQQGKTVSWTNLDTVLTAMISQCGLTSSLGLPA